MEIKINKEIRSYKETVCFGLTARQLICSLLAVGTAMRVAARHGRCLRHCRLSLLTVVVIYETIRKQGCKRTNKSLTGVYEKLVAVEG